MGAQFEVKGAGVDTWSLGWYTDPQGETRRWFEDQPTFSGGRATWLAEKVAGYRVGLYPNGLLKAEGHPDPDGLCPATELLGRALDAQEGLRAYGVPVPSRERRFASLGATSEGFAGVGRVDASLDLKLPSRAVGLGVLSGVAVLLDQKGLYYGADRGIQTAYVLGSSGRKLGRVYDKGLET